MKKQIPLDAWTDFQEGDQVVSVAPGYGTITVERDVPDPPKPGTIGTATVRGVKGVRGVWASLFDGDPYFVILEADKAGTGSLSSTANLVTDFVPEPTKPQITRENFIKTLKSVVEDNMLDTGEEFDTVIVFAADRLGLY